MSLEMYPYNNYTVFIMKDKWVNKYISIID